MSFSKRLAGLACVLFTFLALGACAAPAPTDDGSGSPTTPSTDQTLTIINSYKVANLDPIKSGTNWLFDWGIAENLMQVAEDGTVEPWLAESVERSDDLTWSIQLRPDMTFQNGKPVDAEAVARSLNRQIAESEAVQIYMSPESEFIVTGDLSLELTTPEPNAMVPAALSARDNAMQVYDVDALEAAAGDSEKIVGAGAFTGPYAITEWNPELLELDRYDDHWAGTPAMSHVTVQVVADEQARISAVQSGQADLAFYPSPDAKLALAGESNAYFLSSELALQALLVDMNLTRAPFDELPVRQAFIASVNYDELAAGVSNDVFDVAKGLYPESMPYALNNQAEDVDKANELLESAGWTLGPDGYRSKDGQTLTVRFVTQQQGPETLALAQAMQSQVKRTGFDLQIINSEDSGTLKQDMSAWESSIGLNGSLSGTADPIQPFRWRWTTGGTANYQGLSDPRLDEIGDELATTFDEQERNELLKEGQRIIVEDEAYVFSAAFKRFSVIASPQWQDYQVSNVRAHLRWNTQP